MALYLVRLSPLGAFAKRTYLVNAASEIEALTIVGLDADKAKKEEQHASYGIYRSQYHWELEEVTAKVEQVNLREGAKQRLL